MGKREQEDELLQKKKERQRMKKKRRRQEGIIRAGVCIAALALVVGVTALATNLVVGEEKPGKKPETEKSSAAVVETEPAGENAEILEEADRLAAGYDYDAAVAKIKSVNGYEQKTELTQAIIRYTEAQKKCVPVDVDTVPHIFYHSLMNEPTIALDASIVGQGAADGMNAWMTTVEEFDKITQQMYDNGYVFVRLHDLVVETTDEMEIRCLRKMKTCCCRRKKKQLYFPWMI